MSDLSLVCASNRTDRHDVSGSFRWGNPIWLSLLIYCHRTGLTEFLPVSSSGHLILIPIITNFDYQGRLIDVAAHVGTLIAVTLYLRIEIIAIIIALFRLGRSDPANARLGLVLALATIPVVIAGYFVNYADWHWLNMVQTLAIANFGFAIILWLSDTSYQKRGLDSGDLAACTFNWPCTDLCAYSRSVTFRRDNKRSPLSGI